MNCAQQKNYCTTKLVGLIPDYTVDGSNNYLNRFTPSNMLGWSFMIQT